MNGSMGVIHTNVGIPLSLSLSRTSKRLAVPQTSGSNMRHRSSSQVVTVIWTTALAFRFISSRMSMSRRTRSDLVISDMPNPRSRTFSRHLLVSNSSLSHGI